KTEAVPGTRVVYFEIDSLLPRENPLFMFMEKEKWRVRTVKLRGQISQGLPIPLSSFPQLAHLAGEKDGYDVTEALGVVKWEPPEEALANGSRIQAPFPSFIAKTEEPRAQNMAESMDGILQNHDLHVSIKLDGTSATYFYHHGEFGVCSRNVYLKEAGAADSSHYFAVARLYGICERLTSLGRNMAIQGEICGPGINGNRQKLTETCFYVFTVQDLTRGCRLPPEELAAAVSEINAAAPADKKLVLVPLVCVAKPGTLKTFADIEQLSGGSCLLNSSQREGIVLRHGTDISFKMINPRYLLKHGI
ncbi:hypothetical protein HDU91_000529, partial [Kappamyces sp. JEL0680]